MIMDERDCRFKLEAAGMARRDGLGCVPRSTVVLHDRRESNQMLIGENSGRVREGCAPVVECRSVCE